MEKTKVTRNFQITIPASIRKKINLKEGDIIEVYLDGDDIIIRKARSERPRIKLGKRLTLGNIEKAIELGESE
ncbi:MAG: AbrB/MazE/SpoVT family DNA-binding domain-containing protein [Thermocladium sp.]|jgi:AbrB family looped-hinge helix DNA binding protein|nr:MAG: AbrB family transcriptional regulator [Thermocladium sp. ECH_B]